MNSLHEELNFFDIIKLGKTYNLNYIMKNIIEVISFIKFLHHNRTKAMGLRTC
jgi:hypothetical protein